MKVDQLGVEDDPRFSEEQREFAMSLARYARERLKPDYARWDSYEPFPQERIAELANLGVMGLRVPVEYGGTGAPYVTVGLAAEMLTRGDFNATYFVQLSAIAADILTVAGGEVAKKWLPPLAAGEQTIALALTEPEAGSDAANVSMRARPTPDGWVLAGEKSSISFAGFADACVTFARSGGPGAQGISAFLVPLNFPGVRRQVYKSPGGRLTQRGSLFFDDVEIPHHYLLAAEGSGFVGAMKGFDFNRAVIALACTGAAQASIAETLVYTQTRRTFGKVLAENQGISLKLAEHLALLAAARLVAYDVLERCDRGAAHTQQAAMAKWMSPKFAIEAIHTCLVIHGHYGYSNELPFEQRLRDVIGLEIGDGTPEIMKAIIAREAYGGSLRIF